MLYKYFYEFIYIFLKNEFNPSKLSFFFRSQFLFYNRLNLNFLIVRKFSNSWEWTLQFEAIGRRYNYPRADQEKQRRCWPERSRDNAVHCLWDEIPWLDESRAVRSYYVVNLRQDFRLFPIPGRSDTILCLGNYTSSRSSFSIPR